MTSAAPPRSNPGRPELFRQLVECSQDPILTKTADGRITFWNPAAEQLYGYLADQAVGRNIGLIIPAICRPRRAICSNGSPRASWSSTTRRSAWPAAAA